MTHTTTTIPSAERMRLAAEQIRIDFGSKDAEFEEGVAVLLEYAADLQIDDPYYGSGCTRKSCTTPTCRLLRAAFDLANTYLRIPS